MLRRHLLPVLLALLWLPLSAPCDSLKQLAEQFAKGRYEDVIEATTATLEAQPEKPQPYQYLRGLAAYRLAWFGRAEDDLEPLGDFQLGPTWPKASEGVDRVEQLREIAPQNVRELKDRGEVIFRVYYDQDNRWTQALIRCLPDIYREVTDFYGPRLVETAVLIFAERERYDEFSRTLTKETPPEWSVASGGNGLLLFCEHMPNPDYEITADTLPSTAAHEFSHCLTQRVLGNTRLPMWLDEGLAEYLGSKFNEPDLSLNDQQITALLDQDVVLPMRALTSENTFYDDNIAKRAYPQAFAMIRYLVSQVGSDGVIKLLNAIHEGATGPEALAQLWEGGQEAFFEDWLAATQARVARLRGQR